MAIKELIEQNIKELNNKIHTSAIISNNKVNTCDTIKYGTKAPIPQHLR